MITDEEWADIQAEGEGPGWVFVIGAEGKSFITSVSATRLDGTTRTEQEAQEIALETARRSFLATFGRDPNSVRASCQSNRA